MVFVGAGLSLSDIRSMDIGEYLEAVAARLMYQEELDEGKKKK